jgi:hypothetical protein
MKDDIPKRFFDFLNRHTYRVADVLHELEISDHFNAGNIFIAPPDAGEVTDEDSGEEEGGTVNNLSKGQLLSEAIATTYNGTERRDIGNFECEQPSDSDDDDVPLKLLKSSTRCKARQQRKEKQGQEQEPRRWCKRDLPPASRFLQWSVSKPKFLRKEWSPVSLFQLFFDDDIIEFVCDSTMKYAGQKGNHTFSVDRNEMRSFLAILMISGYSTVPRRRMYWQKDDDVHNSAVKSLMARNRFEEIIQFLHVADNTSLAAGDKMAKVRPLLRSMNERFLLYNPCQQDMSIDESMIPYYGHHGCKQFIRGKPIRFGYKMWCLNTTTGYLIQFEPYQGAGTVDIQKSLGMGGSVIVDLIAELPSDRPYRLYFDNLFTSLKLVDVLTERGIGATGTVRVNRIEKCPLVDVKMMSKKPRGSYDYMLDEEHNLIVIRWNDNSVVTVVSNCHGLQPIMNAQRWSSSQGKRIDIAQPFNIHAYNNGMGGVDRMDQNISKYRVQIRSKKWWWPFFAYIVDVSVQNAWLLYRLCPSYNQRQLDLLGFRREICQVCVLLHFIIMIFYVRLLK